MARQVGCRTVWRDVPEVQHVQYSRISDDGGVPRGDPRRGWPLPCPDGNRTSSLTLYFRRLSVLWLTAMCITSLFVLFFAPCPLGRSRKGGERGRSFSRHGCSSPNMFVAVVHTVVSSLLVSVVYTRAHRILVSYSSRDRARRVYHQEKYRGYLPSGCTRRRRGRHGSRQGRRPRVS
ncbi:uncharacterized protein B0H18DRAFT_975220 [Fomitopsis serialis]|uniref:uncharacterized protein n=1 Tax=Fomitopsis serialis TaxID=139415 RepID=UPI0020079933|nr:uncharacterized protein B0H18DRAFT_975220 [Neoantrodia serialis]KAH9935304.1 hypothetical protein B0H18DRAFT_975220 [Neoantrodia serialis]